MEKIKILCLICIIFICTGLVSLETRYDWLEYKEAKIKDDNEEAVIISKTPICRRVSFSNEFFQLYSESDDIVLLIEIRPDYTVGEIKDIKVDCSDELLEILKKDIQHWSFVAAKNDENVPFESWNILYISKLLRYYYHDPDIIKTEISYEPEVRATPLLKRFIQPPILSKYDNKEGTFLASFYIDLNGNIGDVFVMTSIDSEFDKSYIEFYRKFKYNPAKENDKPVSSWVIQRIEL